MLGAFVSDVESIVGEGVGVSEGVGAAIDAITTLGALGARLSRFSRLLSGGKGGGDSNSGGSSNRTHVGVIDGEEDDVLTMLIVDTYALDAQFCIMRRVWR